LVETLTALNYYDITVQPFTVPDASATLSVNGQAYEVIPMTFTSAGRPAGPVVVVANFGCFAASQIPISRREEIP
jgi:hypothetical protein